MTTDEQLRFSQFPLSSFRPKTSPRVFRLDHAATLILVTTDGKLNTAMAVEVEEMLRDGRIEGLVRQIQRAYPALVDEAEAAVGHAVEALVGAKKNPDKPFSYLVSCAFNEIKKIGKFRARSVSLDALKDGTEWELAYDEWSAEERALVDETYKVLMLHVSTWGTNNVRIVTEAYLEAAHLGEPPRAADVADELSSLTGNEVSEEEVRSWKSRGFKKLRAYVEARWAEEQE